MGGSTNTVLHLLAAAREAELDFGVADIDAISRRVPCLSKVAPEHARSTTWRTCTGPAASRPSSASWTGAACCTATCTPCTRRPGQLAGRLGHPRRHGRPPEALELFHAAPGGVRTTEPFSTDQPLVHAGHRRRRGLHPRPSSTPTPPTAGWPSCFGNLAPDGCVVKTAGVPDESLTLPRPGPGLRVAGGRGRRRSSASEVVAGDVVVIRYEGPRGGPGHAGDALPDVVPQGPRPGQGVRADHRRPVLRRHLGPVDRARLPRGGRRRADRAGRGRRRDRHRHPGPHRSRSTSPTRSSRPAAIAQEKRGPPVHAGRPASGRSRRRCGRTPRWPPRPATAPTAASPTNPLAPIMVLGPCG